MHLYVTKTDSSGRPLPDQVIQDGPALVIPVAQEEGKPIEIRYDFDPPLQLPAPGKYWFAIKEDWCDAGFLLHASKTNPYPDGEAWMTSPDLRCIGVGGSPGSFGGDYDLIFTLEFCTDGTPNQTRTWGSLKAHYR